MPAAHCSRGSDSGVSRRGDGGLDRSRDAAFEAASVVDLGPKGSHFRHPGDGRTRASRAGHAKGLDRWWENPSSRAEQMVLMDRAMAVAAWQIHSKSGSAAPAHGRLKLGGRGAERLADDKSQPTGDTAGAARCGSAVIVETQTGLVDARRTGRSPPLRRFSHDADSGIMPMTAMVNLEFGA